MPPRPGLGSPPIGTLTRAKTRIVLSLGTMRIFGRDIVPVG